MRLFPVASGLLVSILLIQCRSESRVNKGTLHPTPENIPEATDPGLVVDLKNLDEWEEKPLFADTTGFAATVFGRDDGEEYEMLSFVRDIVFDGKGAVFILDADPRSRAMSSVRVVHMVDTRGQYLGSIGQPGEGPGEFMHVDHLLLAEEGNLLLVAGRERHIDVFRRGNTGEFEFERRIETRTSADDACAMGDHFYLLAYDPDNGGVIHKYALNGEYADSFGDAYISSNPRIVSALSRSGQLACNAEFGVVGFIRDSVPVLTAFGEDGELLWRMRVEGIKSVTEILETVSDEGRPSIRYSTANQLQAGRGSIRVTLARSDGFFYVTAFVSVGEGQRRSLVFRVDALTGAWDHVGRGPIPAVVEEGLIVRRPSYGAEQVQVRIWTRNG